MTRLPYIRNEDLDEEGSALWDGILETRGIQLVTDSGGMAGPFNAWMHAPGIGRPASRLGSVLRFGTSVERRLLEMAIITVGAHWKAEFEWWAHARMASDHGISDAVIMAIGNGDIPEFEHDDERVVHSVASQLMQTGRIDDQLYPVATDLLGHRGMVEIVSLCGYYTMISFTLNAFEVPLPPGVEQRWAD